MNNSRWMKAIFIDTKNKRVVEVEVMNYGAIRALINCDKIEGTYLDDNNEIYIDEEGIFNSENEFFFMKDWAHPLAGNGVILGFDAAAGLNKSHSANFQEIKENIVFMDKHDVRNWTLLNK